MIRLQPSKIIKRCRTLLNRFLLDSIEISSCSVSLNIRLLSKKNIEKIRNSVSSYLNVRIFALSRYTLSFLFFSFLKKNIKSIRKRARSVSETSTRSLIRKERPAGKLRIKLHLQIYFFFFFFVSV